MKQEYRIIPIEIDKIRHIARKMRRNGVILAMIHGYLDQNNEPVVSYEYQLDPDIESYTIHGYAELPTISDIYDKAAEWAERELNELYGFKFKGLDSSKRLFLPDNMLSGQGQIIATPMEELIRDRYKEKDRELSAASGETASGETAPEESAQEEAAGAGAAPEEDISGGAATVFGKINEEERSSD